MAQAEVVADVILTHRLQTLLDAYRCACGENFAPAPNWLNAIPEDVERAHREHVGQHVVEALATEAAAVHRLLHSLWLAVHVRRFDGHDYPHGRPDHVSKKRPPDNWYAGIIKAQRIVEDAARDVGIDRVFDTPPAIDTEESQP